MDVAQDLVYIISSYIYSMLSITLFSSQLALLKAKKKKKTMLVVILC